MKAVLVVALLLLAGCASKDVPQSSKTGTTTPLAGTAPSSTSSSPTTSSSPAPAPSPSPGPAPSTSSATPSVEPVPTPPPGTPTHDIAHAYDGSIGAFVCVVAPARAVCSNQVPVIPRGGTPVRFNGAALDRVDPAGILDHATLTLTWTASSPLTQTLEFRATPLADCQQRCMPPPGTASFVVNGTSPLSIEIPTFPNMQPADMLQFTVRPLPMQPVGVVRGSAGQDVHLEGTLTYFDDAGATTTTESSASATTA